MSKRPVIHIMNSLGQAALTALILLFIHMILTKPANASWSSWPRAYMVGLLQCSDAPTARAYLGITTGAPGAETDTDASSMTTDEDYIYVSLGDDQWVQVAVDDVVSPIKLETSGYVLQEDNTLALTE